MEILHIIGENISSSYDRTLQLLKTIGYDAKVWKVDDPTEVASFVETFGISKLPALILDGEIITTGDSCESLLKDPIRDEEKD